MTNVQSQLEAGDQPPALERPRSSRADEATLTALYEEHSSEILGFLVRMTRDRGAAEDVLQETFVSLISESRAGKMPDLVRPWLYRTATNAVISRSRRRLALARLLPRLLDRREPEQPEANHSGLNASPTSMLRWRGSFPMHVQPSCLPPRGSPAPTSHLRSDGPRAPPGP